MAPESSTSGSTATSRKNEEEYVPLCRAIQMGEWEKAQEFFNDDKDAMTDILNIRGHRALHVAIGNHENVGFLQNLLEQINPESLPTLVNNKQQNGLHYNAILDNTIAAKKLVEKNPHLLFIVDYQKFLPIQIAIFNSHKSTFLYLLQVCKKHTGLSQMDGYHNPFEGESGVSLLSYTILSGFLDVAYDLLKDFPELASTKVLGIMPPLWCIAQMRDVYPSAKPYNFYQRFVYSHVPTETCGLDEAYKNWDVENQDTYRANIVTNRMKAYFYTVSKKIHVKFWKLALLYVMHIKHLHEDKMKHNIALMILKFICEEVVKLRSDHFGHYGDAFIVAVNNNTPEVIEQISQIFPQAIWTRNANDYSLPQLSIMNRCEHIYNFLAHEVTQDKYLHNVRVDKYENNLLHLAGQLAPTDKLNMVTGAALQMQREFQWFQEVSKFMRPKEREAKNKKQETPIMVFRK